MASTLGGPSVTLLHWSPTQGGYVDTAGHVVPVPVTGDKRAAVDVVLGDERLGVILYDPRLNTDPAAAAAVGRVAAIAIDRERLAGEVLESRQALRDASSRLLSEATASGAGSPVTCTTGCRCRSCGCRCRLTGSPRRPAVARAGRWRRGWAVEADEAASTLRAIVMG